MYVRVRDAVDGKLFSSALLRDIACVISAPARVCKTGGPATSVLCSVAGLVIDHNLS